MPVLAVSPLFLSQLKSAVGSFLKPHKPCSKSQNAEIKKRLTKKVIKNNKSSCEINYNVKNTSQKTLLVKHHNKKH